MLLPSNHTQKGKGRGVLKPNKATITTKEKCITKTQCKSIQLTWQTFQEKQKEVNTNMIIKALDKDLDIRDRWLGIRQLKQDYQPNPYARRATEGIHITQKQRAQQAAEYLNIEQ